MILLHAMVVYAVNMGDRTVIGVIVGILGTAPAAPVFMVVMGVFLGRPKRPDVRQGMIRGLRLLALGYLLNLTRLALPLRVYTGSWTTEVESFTAWSALWMVDILQLAGLSVIVLTLLRHILPWRAAWLGLCLAIVFASPLLWGVADFPGSDLLWGTAREVTFPLLPWLVYPLLGMAIAPQLLHAAGGGRPMRRLAKLGAVFLVVGVILCDVLADTRFRPGGYARMGPGFVALIVGFVMIWLPLCNWLVRRIPHNRVFDFLSCWSRYVTTVYVVQWVLIGWGVLLFGYQQRSALQAAGLGVTVLLVSHAIMKVYVLRGPEGRRRRREIRALSPA
jgi:hypothetical protein